MADHDLDDIVLALICTSSINNRSLIKINYLIFLEGAQVQVELGLLDLDFY